MRFLVLWCAGFLCSPQKRFHITCLFCRKRRKWLGKWTLPHSFISWILPWSIQEDGSWQSIEIDPRGNATFKFFRCCAIICFISLANWFHNHIKRLQQRPRDRVRSMTMARCVNIAEFLANLAW